MQKRTILNLMFDQINPHDTIWELLRFFWPRLFFAVLCGGCIGLERELKNKAAGIKTNMLICVGASLYTSISVLIATSLALKGTYGDPSRVAAQIVSGIGFLGGGAIIQSRGTIQGLTTAATIWVVAAIGCCIGLGYSGMAILATISVIAVLLLATLFEDRILGRSIIFTSFVVIEGTVSPVRKLINDCLQQNDLVLEDLNLTDHGEQSLLTLCYTGHRDNYKKFVLDLWNIPGIKEVRQE